MRILIVDDDYISRRILLDHLSPLGLCDIAVDGVEALEAVHLSLEEDRPYDLICLDIEMPKMDGQKTLQRIRDLELQFRDNKWIDAKILMTTAMDDWKNISRAFREQSDGYLVKPIILDDLLQKLEELDFIAPESRI